ncbi:MAG: hypothetical protein R3317_11480, partial [Burkholderiaceae bacterium]|nr:hypothetical protein [Burkholderiaceae bacterium]
MQRTNVGSDELRRHYFSKAAWDVTPPFPLGWSYAGFWVTRPDQAARFLVPFAATPSVNVMPSMIIGNRFAPFRRRELSHL